MLTGDISFIDNIMTIIKDIVVVASPVILTIFTYKSSKKEKGDKAYREVRAQLDARLEEEKKTRDENIDKTLHSLSNDIKEVKDKVEEIDLDNIQKQLNDLKELNGINLGYSQSLSRVVVKMAESMKDSSIPQDTQKSIEAVIEEHQEKEKEITKTIYQLLY